MKTLCFNLRMSLLAIALVVTLCSSSQDTLLDTAKPVPSASAAIAAPVAGDQYRVDAGRSRFIVRAFVGGLLSSFGHDHTIAIKDFTGTAEITGGTVEPASLQLTIKADSLSVIDKVSDSDRQKIETTMREEVLETAKYPDIVFRSTSISANKVAEGQFDAKIWGELTLHGVTRSGLINARVTVSANSLRARGEFPLKQTDYNIKPVSVAAGTIKVKNDLKLSFDIVATR